MYSYCQGTYPAAVMKYDERVSRNVYASLVARCAPTFPMSLIWLSYDCCLHSPSIKYPSIKSPSVSLSANWG